MSDISSTSALSSLISQYGTDEAKASVSATSSTSAATQSSDSLASQDVFLQLYIEQLKNQDPTSPQDTGDMVSQMAEFSSLERLTEMSSEISSMTEALVSSQALTASTLVGKSAYVEKDTATVSDGSSVSLKTTFPDDAQTVKLTIKNEDGETVDIVTLTDESYTWDGTDSDGNVVEDGDYTFQVTSTNSDGEVTQLGTLLPARINSVTINGSEGATLNIQGYGSLTLSDEIEVVG